MTDITLNLNCYETTEHDEPWSLETYRKIGGYEAWEKIINEKTPPSEIIELVKSSGLRGRGGAGHSRHGRPRLRRQQHGRGLRRALSGTRKPPVV